MAVKATSITRMADGSVRVLVPAEVLYNVEKSQAVVRSILGKVGCPTCHSGLPILLQGIEQEFVADAAGAVRTAG
jgi:hypothetical protein